MKNEEKVTIQENGREVKHRYRLNKRKFTMALSVICFATAAIIIAAHYVRSDEGKEAIVAIELPQPTATVNSTAAPDFDPEKPLKGKIIVVDAGHGGEDPGAIGVNGSVESKLNLSVAFILKQQLEDKGSKVIMTRSDDTLAETKEQDWDKRQEIITNSGPDILVSIHMNKFGDTSVSGPLVIFLPGSVQGKKLAEIIQRSMNETLDPETPGRARSEDFQILRYGSQPSVLVECGYISNPQEEEKLNTQEYQLKAAKAVCDGVIRYFIS